MAIKIQQRRKIGVDTYEEMYPKTQADCVSVSSGGNLQTKLSDIDKKVTLSLIHIQMCIRDSSTNDYTAAEKQKLAGIAQNANNYTHPSTHPASMVVFSDGHTFQQKLDQGELKGDKGDSFKVGETYDTAIEKTFFFKLMP